MFAQWLELYQALPVSQKGTVLAATLAVTGVVITAVVTFFTALVNGASSSLSSTITKRYDLKHWKREKLWNAYIETISKYNKVVEFHENLVGNYMAIAIYNMELALEKEYPGLYDSVYYIKSEADDSKSVRDFMENSNDEINRMIRKYNDTPVYDIIDNGIMLDKNFRYLESSYEALRSYLFRHYSEMFSWLTSLHQEAVELLTSNSTQNELDLFRAKVAQGRKAYSNDPGDQQAHGLVLEMENMTKKTYKYFQKI